MHHPAAAPCGNDQVHRVVISSNRFFTFTVVYIHTNTRKHQQMTEDGRITHC